jgi:hypothetical protein
MSRRALLTFAVVGIHLVAAAGSARAQVGEPLGAFDITLSQGGGVVAQHSVTIGAGGDLVDLQPSWVDGTPESFTQIGTIGPSQSPIILKVTMDGDSTFRMLHWYIDVPGSLADIYSAGPTSLFDPNRGNIGVTVSGLSFNNPNGVQPFICDNSSYMVSFMRDVQGHFYESPSTLPYDAYGHGVNDIEVPGQTYLDGDISAYNFTVLETGSKVSWSWSDILNPGLGTTVHNGLAGGVPPLSPGYVFELGLSVALIHAPEPGTFVLMVAGLVPMLRRRRGGFWPKEEC